MDLIENKLPKSGMALYVKFYCKQVNQNNDKKSHKVIEEPLMIAATKSWVALSQEQKMMFTMKLKEYKEEYKKNFAEYLKSVDLFMKKKQKRQPNLNQIEPDVDMAMAPGHNTQINEEVGCNAVEPRYQEQADNRQSDDKTPEPDQLPQNASDIQHETEPEVPEPIPPNVKSSEELFQLVKSMEGEGRSWRNLSKLEKKRYQSSLLAVKKAYIQKYKAFLESLTSEQLFQYYNTKLHT